ncbi:MAG: MCE family protein [Phycisphaerales bacterium]|nr:MAG: MCE family protein [Phycisphaerales bacterium]
MSAPPTEPPHDGAGNSSTPASNPLPTAILRPRRRISALWLLPVAALILAGFLAHRTLSLRGTVVIVRLADGHGLKAGDPVRYRGINVGQVRQVDLDEDLESILITASLQSQGSELARRGSRFWVVRPEVGLGGVAGLETLIGPRYLAVLPGNGAPQRHFVGLESPPIIEAIEPGDLEIIVRASRRGGLRPGAPVLYRQVRVGTIMSLGLTTDAGAVEARVHIENAFAQLIRQETRFWRVPGVEAEFGLAGIALDVDSLETLLLGGIAFATPPLDEAGEPVRTGHRFDLADEVDDDWLDWEPVVAIGSSMLPPGLALPDCQRARITWKQGLIFKGAKSRQGWVLPVERGLLGPADLMVPGEKAEEETVVLEVAGRVVSLDREPVWSDPGLALLEATLPTDCRRWSSRRIRAATEPEDCIAVADPASDPLPLAAARLTAHEDGWLIDQAVPIDETFHGAAVLARTDGRLLGMVLVNDDDDEVIVALLPEDWK